MLNLLITDIAWEIDDEGVKPQKDCNLPAAILLIGAPESWRGTVFMDKMEEAMQNTYGFRYGACKWKIAELDSPTSRFPWPKEHLAVMSAPTV